MKKKIIGGLAVLVIATVATFNVNLGSKANNLSDVSLTNIDALAGTFQLAVNEVTNQIYCCGSAGYCARTTTGDSVTGKKQYEPC